MNLKDISDAKKVAEAVGSNTFLVLFQDEKGFHFISGGFKTHNLDLHEIFNPTFLDSINPRLLGEPTRTQSFPE